MLLVDYILKTFSCHSPYHLQSWNKWLIEKFDWRSRYSLRLPSKLFSVTPVFKLVGLACWLSCYWIYYRKIVTDESVLHLKKPCVLFWWWIMSLARVRSYLFCVILFRRVDEIHVRFCWHCIDKNDDITNQDKESLFPTTSSRFVDCFLVVLWLWKQSYLPSAMMKTSLMPSSDGCTCES